MIYGNLRINDRRSSVQQLAEIDGTESGEVPPWYCKCIIIGVSKVFMSAMCLFIIISRNPPGIQDVEHS